MTNNKKIIIKGGKLPKDYVSPEFLLDISLDNVPQSTIEKWIYAERKIAFQRIREFMSRDEIESMIKDAPKNENGVPVVTIHALKCGSKIETTQKIEESFISAATQMSKQRRLELIKQLEELTN